MKRLSLIVPIVLLCGFTYGFENNPQTGKPDMVVTGVTPSDVGAPSGSGTSTGANTGDVTIGTANGLSLVGQVLSLQAATNSVAGAMTAADHTAFAAKEPPITSGTTAQYLRGDKSLATFNTDVIAAVGYSTGTWTPGVSFGGSATGATYSVQSGRYLKIGRLVWVEGVVILTSNGSGTGTARITGLPATVTNETASNGASMSVGYVTGSGILGLTGSFEPSGTTIVLYVPGAAASVAATDINITDTSQIFFSGFFLSP